MEDDNVPPLPDELKGGVIKDEILRDILIFITIMLICKLCSSIWRFRLYRKSVRKYAVPKKSKLPRVGNKTAQFSTDLVDTIRIPKHAVGVRSRIELRSSIRIGQHCAVRREYLGYPLYHHMLISDYSREQIHIIHYNGEAGVFLKSGSKIFGHVIEERVDIDDDHYFDIPQNFFLVHDPVYPSDPDAVDGVIKRARERIGENRYGMTYNNCEHFVRWALTGKPHCQQYETANMTDKVVGSMVDELPNIGARMSMKICKEVLYAITMGVEQAVLQNSARLIQHTASASVATILSTGAATLGWTAPVEAAFLTFRILDWKYHKSKGTMSIRDYNNAKDKAITGSVFSLVFTTLGAMFGQLIIPLPAIGAMCGSFWGGFIGRILGIVLAGYGIAVKEKYFFETRYRRLKLWIFRSLSKFIDRWKARCSYLLGSVSVSVSFPKQKKL